MGHSRLLFPLDKNYTLKEAQSDTKSHLLLGMVEKVKHYYLVWSNPLGIEDDTIKAINSCHRFSMEHFDVFYHEIAGVYRYKIGSNQLEFIFNGRSHYDKYRDDWSEAFEIWIEGFLTYPHFIRAVLEMAILNKEDRVAFLASNRLKVFITQYFAVKVYKYRGILPYKVVA